jgi:hypothetical protein
MSDPWFDTKGKMNDEEPATPEEVQALRELLSGSITPQVAAKCIMTTREDRIPLNDKLNRVAWLIFDAIIHFEEQQPLLTELVEAIHILADDDLVFTDEQKERFPNWASWKDFDKFELLVDDMRRCKYSKSVSH